MIVDKVRNLRIEEAVPITIRRVVPHNSVADEERQNIVQIDKMPVVHPYFINEQFYGPNGKMVREEKYKSWIA